MRRGRFGSSSMAARNREMCTSIERSKSSRDFALGQVHECFARQHAPGALGQRQQNRELVAGERLAHAIDAHLARPLVDLQPAKMQHLRAALRQSPAQDGAQSRQQLARLEGLGKIVVRTEFETHDTIQRIAARREHEHRHVGLRAQAAAQIEAIGIRQHEIEDHRVEGFRCDQLHGTRAGAGARGAKARLAQVVGDHRGEAGIIFDEQDAVHCHSAHDAPDPTCAASHRDACALPVRMPRAAPDSALPRHLRTQSPGLCWHRPAP